MRFSHFFKENYWVFRPMPAAHAVLVFWLLVLFGMTAAGIILFFLKQRGAANALLFEKYSYLFSTLGIIGLILFYFRQEGVAFLGSRLWFLLWFVVLIIWLVTILKYQFRRMPKIRAEQTARAAREKYLPGKH